MKTIPVSFLVAGMLAPAVCLAQPQGPDGEFRSGKSRPGEDAQRPFAEAWKNADANDDGFISLAEFHGIARIQVLPEDQREKIFERLDKNGDGNLGRDELMRFSRPHDGPAKKRLWELDVDRSGGISIEEFREGHFFKKLPAAKVTEVFSHLDTDQDGLITPSDRPESPFKKVEGKPRPKGKKGSMGPKDSEAEHPGKDGDADRLGKLIRNLDADGNGGLSFEEFRIGAGVEQLGEDEQEDRFEKLDHNGDLEISMEDAPIPPRPPGGKN